MTKISKKQLQANQKNAQKGGVKTDAGKKVVRYNATKHGIFSSKNIIQGESPRVFSKLAGLIFDDLKPEGAMEELLVQKIISIVWRQRRLLLTEASLSKDLVFQKMWVEEHMEALYWPFKAEDLDLAARYEKTLDNGMYKAMKELERLQAKRKSNN